MSQFYRCSGFFGLGGRRPSGSALVNLGHTDNATTRGDDGEITGDYAFRGTDATGGPNGGVRYDVVAGETYLIRGVMGVYDGATSPVSGTVMRIYDMFSSVLLVSTPGSFEVSHTFASTVLDFLCTSPGDGFRCEDIEIYRTS